MTLDPVMLSRIQFGFTISWHIIPPAFTIHDPYSRAIRMELSSRVWHRTNCYLNNRVEQDHRGI